MNNFNLTPINTPINTGLAIGAAWSGMLGNFAAGVFMQVLRPYKVGDFIQTGG